MNRKIISAALAIFSLTFTLTAAFGEGTAESASRSITVKGYGSITAAPDIVRLNLGVQSMNPNLDTAISDNEARMSKIIEVINKYGIPESDYRTSNFSVYYQQPYNTGMGQSEGTYNVNNNIFIEFGDIEKIGSFVQEALSAGANQFYGLEYSIRNPEPLLKQARKAAIENALKLAKETAEYAGVETGEILSISELPYYSGMPMLSEGIAMGAKANSIITAPGEKTVEVQMEVTFAIK